ncbi:MAG: hypothetical protein ACFFAS_17425 [Promethearchaeota archaeon]
MYLYSLLKNQTSIWMGDSSFLTNQYLFSRRRLEIYPGGLAEAARNKLISIYFWIITDGGPV